LDHAIADPSLGFSTGGAKLPAAPADPAKAEAKAKADAAATQKDGESLGKAQDRAVANYRKNKGIKAPASMAGKK